MYISDHGESLGDNGIDLHGVPNWLAPKEQRHIPWIVWPAERFNESSSKTLDTVSHDNLSHTLLDYFGVITSLYDDQLDLTRNNNTFGDASIAP